MAGSAVKQLFTSSIINDSQFQLMSERLIEFGEWTQSLISRQNLIKSIEKHGVTDEVFQQYLAHKLKFTENYIMTLAIEATNNTDHLQTIINGAFGKKLRNQANQKLIQLNKTNRHE